MARLVTILVVAAIACRLLSGLWPWELARVWLSPGSAEEARARALLGVRKFATHDEIIDAHRRLVMRVHPDRGGTGEQVVAANAARDLLLARLTASHKERP